MYLLVRASMNASNDAASTMDDMHDTVAGLSRADALPCIAGGVRSIQNGITAVRAVTPAINIINGQGQD